MSFKHLFSQSLAAAPERLHVAAHSHHLWPDAALAAHGEAAADAARLADHKWARVFDAILPAARAEVASELALPSPDTVTFAPNTHEFLVRMASCFPADRPLRVLTTDGEFHSLSRQLRRWEEAGQAAARRVPVAPFDTFTERFCAAVGEADADWVLFSHVFFRSGGVVTDLPAIADALHGRPDWLIVDGYHGFMAVETDFSALAGRAFYLAGGYKYAMAGEGACFLHAPAGFGPRPVNTGWYAAFEALADAQDGGVPFAEGGARFTGATFDPSGLYRFVAVRRMLAQHGLTTAAVSAHVRALQDRFATDVAEGRAGRLSDATLLAARETGRPRARFLAYRHRDAAAWCAALAEAGVVADVRDDVLRLGFGLYHDGEDIARLAAICARVLG